MSASRDLVTALKAELKAAGITYADLADALGLAESSVKRIFAKADMPLSRIDAVLQVLKMDFADLARRVAESRPLRHELSLAQEQAVVADRRLLLVAICCMSQWSQEQIVAAYTLSEAECAAYFAVLDRLGVIEQRPMQRYRLMLDKTFRWRPDGPVMRYFRQHVVPDYFGGGFDAPGEMLMLVHGQIDKRHTEAYTERLQRVGQELAQQHLADQRLPPERKQAFTLVVGLRSWLFGPFRDMRRTEG